MDLFEFESTGDEEIPPDPAGLAHAIARSGYDIEAALADLIDNSLDAKAKRVLIRLYSRGSAVRRIVVIDDGLGMSEDKLRAAMQFGGRMKHDPHDLGKFGMGLKSASLSQCRRLTVLTMRLGQACGRRWTQRGIDKDWKCVKITHSSAKAFLTADWIHFRLDRQGTAIVWDELEDLGQPNEDLEAILTRLYRDVPNHLGLVFHRFLHRNSIRIVMDTIDLDSGKLGLPRPVTELDPFSYQRSGHEGYPKAFHMQLAGLPPISLRAHIWPAKSTDTGYKLDGGRVQDRQGFYFYRNNRLIQAGGWNRWRKTTEPHTSLARVEINLDPAFDDVFRLTLQKSGLDVPREFVRALERIECDGTTFPQYVRDANEVYRSVKPKPVGGWVAVPGRGVPRNARSTIRKHFGGGPSVAQPIDLKWTKLQNGRVFEIDRDNSRLLLNRRYQPMVGDTGVFETLIFLLLKEEFERQRISKQNTTKLLAINVALMEALITQ